MENIKTFDTYAIFQTGGKQYQGALGRTVSIEKVEGNAGDKVSFSDVLFRKTTDKFEVGQPFVESAVVQASIVKQMKDPKVIAFRFKRRKKVRVKRGHRQLKTIIRIESI